MNIAIDTNLLVYALGGNGPDRRSDAVGVLRKIPSASIVLPAQVVGELYGVLVRKVGVRPGTAREHVESLVQTYRVTPTTAIVLSRALSLSVMTKISVWDAIVLATAAEADCHLLLTEDMDHGWMWSGVTIVNPFEEPMHPLLEQALAQ